MTAPTDPENADLSALRGYAASVIDQSGDESLQMKAVTLALLGGIMWRGVPGSTRMMRDADGSNIVLTTTLGTRTLTFTYDRRSESIKMRERDDDTILHSFCNRTLVKDLDETFAMIFSDNLNAEDVHRD